MRIRQLVRTGVAVGLGAAALTVPGAAHARVPDEAGVRAEAAGLQITFIKCYQTEDWGEDEVYITVQRGGTGNERVVWGPRRMDENSAIEKYSLGIDVRAGDVIRLYEDDYGDNDQKLGGRIVRDGAFWYRFDLHDSLYRIRVRPA